MYSRNYIYISDEDHAKLAKIRLVIAGAGLGSVIAECALRLGIRHITIIDGDTVERSNLNRQNYILHNEGSFKAWALAKRLMEIDPSASIKVCATYLDNKNISHFIHDCDAVVNTIDFSSDAPFVLDNYCAEMGITSIHPYNLGWASLVFCTNNASVGLKSVSDRFEGFEQEMVLFLIERLEESGHDCTWLKDALGEYVSKYSTCPPPQLSIASHLAAAQVCRILYNIAVGKEIKMFPDFYYIDTL